MPFAPKDFSQANKSGPLRLISGLSLHLAFWIMTCGWSGLLHALSWKGEVIVNECKVIFKAIGHIAEWTAVPKKNLRNEVNRKYKKIFWKRKNFRIVYCPQCQEKITIPRVSFIFHCFTSHPLLAKVPERHLLRNRKNGSSTKKGL